MTFRTLALACASLVGCVGDVVGRNDYTHYNVTCERGINQSVEQADPLRECANARNVWAPSGGVIQRPGYMGVTANYYPNNLSSVVYFARAEDVSGATFTSPSGAGVLTLNNLVGRIVDGGDGDRWYLGYSATFNRVQVTAPTTNSNATRFKAEYWNGSAWEHLLVSETSDTTSQAQTHLVGSPFFGFVAPQDWATTTVDGQSAYWIRFNILDADFDASTSIDVDTVSVPPATVVQGLFVASLPTSKLYVTLEYEATGGRQITVARSFPISGEFAWGSLDVTAGTTEEPPSIAVISEFNDVYFSFANRVFLTPRTSTITTVLGAAVDDRDAVVGPGAAFDRNLIVQDASFPQAKYITFFKNRLWAANLLDDPTAVKWSGRSPYYRVWPTLSREPLVEDDNSPITGIKGFQENLVVSKEDSLWIMREDGINEFSLTQYTPVRIVPGIGFVSNSSIVEVNGRLFGLSENGLYAFDGTPNIKNLSEGRGGGDRLVDLWPSITSGRRQFATAVNWSTKGLYLLSVSIDGSDNNNLVIAYDYDNDSFWLWDNIQAQHWMLDQGADDEEILYFGDASGRIYQMGVGRTDHGAAITSYVTSNRLGYTDGVKKLLREVRLFGDSQFTSASVDIYANDAGTASQTATFDFSDPVETTASRPLVRRQRRGDFKVEGDWFQVRVQNTTRNTELRMGALKVGYRALARR